MKEEHKDTFNFKELSSTCEQGVQIMFGNYKAATVTPGPVCGLQWLSQ